MGVASCNVGMTPDGLKQHSLMSSVRNLYPTTHMSDAWFSGGPNENNQIKPSPYPRHPIELPARNSNSGMLLNHYLAFF